MELNCIYHIYNHANGDDDLFLNEEYFMIFLNRMSKYISPVADIMAYCLMPNHFHLVVKIKSDEEVKEVINKVYEKEWSVMLEHIRREKMRILEKPDRFVRQRFSNFFNSYSKTYNNKLFRRGSVFLKNFKKKKVETDDYLTQLIFYVHSNPVSHRFRKKMEEWPWSSYHYYILEYEGFVKIDYILDHFGGIEEFLNFHENKLAIKAYNIGFLDDFKYFQPSESEQESD